ncbi:MAG: sugar ABC transporter permease [Caloramator sp.]|nr:sugar ABC transporter permease [Caloramator sp.]
MSKKALLSEKGKTPSLDRKYRLNKDKILDFVIFVGPALILYTLFFTVPLIQGVVYSFTDWDAIGNYNIIGFKNYIRMFTDDSDFIRSLYRTFYITVFNVFFTNVFAMLLAIALTTRFRINNLLRAIIFLPNMISMVIVGFIWKFMFTKVSAAIYKSTNIAFFNRSWIGDEKNVLFAIILVVLWQGIGYIMTIYIAALLGVDESVIEAAKIDGANLWQVFFKIKLPLMLPVITIGAFINISWSLKIFDVVFSLTGGGPGKSSEVDMLNIYREAFVYNKFGYGSAKAVILSIIIVIATLIQFKLTNKEVA